MLPKIILVTFLVLLSQMAHPQVAVNSNSALPDSHAMLDVSSNSKGVLIPRMTSSQRNAIVAPPKGLLLYDSTNNSFWFYNGAAWVNLTNGLNNWTSSGNDIVNSNPGFVGINSNNPVMRTHIVDTSDRALLLENSLPNQGTTEHATGIYFGHNVADPSNNSKYNSAIKSFDNFVSNTRLGFFTSFDIQNPQLHEWMSITGFGNIGIHTQFPQVELDVNGDISGNIVTSKGSVSNGNSIVNGNLTVSGNISNNGKGIVTSTTSASQKIGRATLTFTATNLPPNGFLVSGTFNFESYADIPTVTMGAVSNGNGNWYQVSIVPASVTNSSCVFILSNNSSVPVTFSNVNWQVMIVGNK